MKIFVPQFGYNLIRAHYGDQKTKRSGVPLINHINEGLVVLQNIGADDHTKEAYCLHPLVQKDEDLHSNIGLLYGVHPKVVALVMEYRSVANEYLSTRRLFPYDTIRLSPLYQVNEMLVADKIQNRKDFERYHAATHPRSKELAEYFHNWLTRLDISDAVYEKIVQDMDSFHQSDTILT